MRTVLAGLGLAAALTAAPALANHTVTLGGTTAPAGYTVFQNFDSLATGSAIGNNAFTYNTSVSNVAAQPDGSTGNFAAVLGGGSATFVLPNAASAFGFLLGSLDSYNTLTINFLDGGSATYSGLQITENLGSNGYLTLDYTALNRRVASATFTSQQNSFEFDDLSFGGVVPEPSTWALLILGFGMIGGAMRRRTNASVAFA